MMNLQMFNNNKVNFSNQFEKNKFVCSLFGHKFEDIYELGQKLGQGGQGSVYSGNICC